MLDDAVDQAPLQGFVRGHEVIAMEGDVTLPQKLAHYKIDIAFNICEGHYGGSREAQVPAVLDMLRIPYTGAGVMTLALALDILAAIQQHTQRVHLDTMWRRWSSV